MLDERAARRMDDAFGHAGGAGRKQDVERMVEGQALEDEFAGSMGLERPRRARRPGRGRQ